MAASYVPLVALPAVRDGTVAEALEDAIVLGGVWLLAELSVFAARRPAAGAAALADVQATSGEAIDSDRLDNKAVQSMEPVTALDYVASVEVAPSAQDPELTAGESHLLACLALGMSNRQIADLLQLSQGAVRYRLTRLYGSLDVRGRSGAVQRARELGMANPIDPRGTSL